jgi:uncharacterized membrane protein YdbT with pleckstrin-like domain
MGFPDKLLNDGEEVVLDLHPHWWFLSGAVAAVVVVLIASIGALVAGAPTALLWFLVVVLLVALGALLVRYARWQTTNFVLTNERVIIRRGILAKQGREIPLEHINDISYNQSLFERIIGAGNVVIESAGERGQEVFPDLPNPATIQNDIYQQIEGVKTRRADPASLSVTTQMSIPEQIEKLDELRQRGVITQAEFDTKKTQLLDRL